MGSFGTWTFCAAELRASPDSVAAVSSNPSSKAGGGACTCFSQTTARPAGGHLLKSFGFPMKKRKGGLHWSVVIRAQVGRTMTGRGEHPGLMRPRTQVQQAYTQVRGQSREILGPNRTVAHGPGWVKVGSSKPET